MFALLHSLGMFGVDLFKPRRRLEVENLVLRYQLSIALRRAPPRLRPAGPQLFGGIECQEHDGVAQRLGAGHLIELREIYDSAYASEGVGNDRLTLLAQFEGDDERWSAKLHAPQDYRDSAREAALNMFD